MSYDKAQHPESIYHYTDIAGFLGIVSEQQMLASNVLYLNDRRETRYLDDLITESVYPRLKEIYQEAEQKRILSARASIDEVVRANCKVLVNGLHRTSQSLAPVFALSFCRATDDSIAANGLLSQWRGYGSSGGIAIRFDRQKFVDYILAAESEKYAYAYGFFGDVIYGRSDVEFDTEVKPRLPIFAEAVVELVEQMLRASGINHKFSGQRRSLEDLQEPYTVLAPRYKHPGFKEEAEYRASFPAVRDPEKLSPKEIKFRTRGNYLLPYIVVNEHKSVRLPIEGVIIGPSIEPQRRLESVRMVLRETGYSKAEITQSDIPFA